MHWCRPPSGLFVVNDVPFPQFNCKTYTIFSRIILLAREPFSAMSDVLLTFTASGSTSTDLECFVNLLSLRTLYGNLFRL